MAGPLGAALAAAGAALGGGDAAQLARAWVLFAALAAAASAWVFLVARRARPGAARAAACAPVVAALLAATPALVDRRRMPVLIGARAQTPGGAPVAAFALGRGPLALPGLDRLPHFGAVMCAPVIPSAAFKLSGGGGAGAAAAGLSSAAPATAAAFGRSYAAKATGAAAAAALATWPVLPELARHWFYALCLSLSLGAIWDAWCLAVTLSLGLRLAPSFDKPWLSTSFADYWSRRWNLTATYCLRVLIYDPIMEGRLLPAGQQAAAPAAGAAQRAPAAAAPAGPELAGAPPAPSEGAAAGPRTRAGAKGGGAVRIAASAASGGGASPAGSSNGSSPAGAAPRPQSAPGRGASAGAGGRRRSRTLRRFAALQATFAFSGLWVRGAPRPGHGAASPRPCRPARAPPPRSNPPAASPPARSAPPASRGRAAARPQHALIFRFATGLWAPHWPAFFAVQAPIIAAEAALARACAARGWRLPQPAAVALTNLLLIVVANPMFFGPCDWSGMSAWTASLIAATTGSSSSLDSTSAAEASGATFPGPGDPLLTPDAALPAAFQEPWHTAFPRLWAEHFAQLERVKLPGGASLAGVARPLLNGSAFASPTQLQRALTHAGPMHRLRRVLRDLSAGRPVKLAVLGGSISWGSAVERGEADWLSLVAARLRAAFPAANVAARNGAVPATPSGWMSLCLEQHLDADADLVFVEYAVNDGHTASAAKRRTFERLLRKVLAQPRRPAVVLVQLPTVGQAFARGHPRKVGFDATVEDAYAALASYYDLPSLSMRGAAWRLAELHHHRMNWTHYYGQGYDFVHVLEQGHALVADMAMFGLQAAALGLALHPMGATDDAELAAPLPPPMFEGARAGAAGGSGQQQQRPPAPPAAARARRVPTPARRAGNWEEVNLLCVHGKAFEGAVSSSRGWAMVNEGDAFKPKFGFVTRQVGAELVIPLSVNATRRGGGGAGGGRLAVQLAYLRSHAGMGTAVVRCAGGCACGEVLIDAHHAQRTSTIYLLRLFPAPAPMRNGAAGCRLSVTVAARSSSGATKFKVTGIMAAELRGDAADGGDDEPGGHQALNDEAWLGAVNKGDGELVERWSKAGKAVAASGGSAGRAVTGKARTDTDR
ncbi:ASAT1 [Scenedesmus sp. PABB004]|nr:ASAT1 [Scenedesmus sp. PABB004]